MSGLACTSSLAVTWIANVMWHIYNAGGLAIETGAGPIIAWARCNLCLCEVRVYVRCWVFC